MGGVGLEVAVYQTGVASLRPKCGMPIHAVKVIACIEDAVVIKKILDHLEKQAVPEQRQLPESRAPPKGSNRS